MRKLIAFNNITLDGYFAGTEGDLGWTKDQDDPEFDAFVADNAKGGGQLLFGRVTYELMAGYWPTPLAKQNDPGVAERINSLPKVVFSRTLDKASWNNTQLVKDDLSAQVRKMKDEAGPDMAVLGSGSIVAQLARDRLIDEFHVVLNPVALGKGRTLFEGIRGRIRLKLTKTRTFASGKVFLSYEPVA